MTIATANGNLAIWIASTRIFGETGPGKRDAWRGPESGNSGIRRGHCRRFLFASICAVILVLSGSFFADTSLAQPNDDSKPLSGRKLQDKLNSRISVAWSSAELGETLVRFSRNQRFALFLDRRVDPNQRIEFTSRNLSVREVLDQLADDTGYGLCWLGDVAYFGPRQSVAELVVLRQRMLEEIEKFPTVAKRQRLSTRPFRCERLSEPTRLLDELLKEAGFQSDGATEQLPHDLMAEYSFPSVRVVDRLILVLYGFDQWFEWDEQNNFRRTSVPVIETAETRIRTSARTRSNVLSHLQNSFPNVEFRVQRNYLTCISDPVTLYEIRRAAAKLESTQSDSVKPDSQSGTQVFTIRSTQAIGSVLKTAAQKLDVDLRFDPALRSELNQRVQLDVVRVTAVELIDAALVGTELDYALKDGVLLIQRREQ